MADNKPIIDGDGAEFQGAADELSDSSFSPKITLLDGTGSPTPISPATAGNQTAAATLTGAVAETAPGTDTASSGLNGRLQRIAQRLTSLIALVPAALGQGTMAQSMRVVLPSDQSTIPVGGNTAVVSVAPVVSASPDYSDGDCLGPKMTLTSAMRVSGGAGVLQNVVMTCEVDIVAGVSVDVLIFDSDPSAGTYTDNAAADVNVADLLKLIGVLHLTDRIDLGTPVALQAANAGMAVKASGSANLYAVAVVRGTTGINLAAVDDINFRFVFLQD